MAEGKGVATSYLEDVATWERSPFIRGMMSGASGAAIGGGAGAIVQALRGKNPIHGAILGAIGTGLLVGAARHAVQSLENKDKEAYIRYHTDQIKSREPFFFMPDKDKLKPLLRNWYKSDHQVDEAPAASVDHVPSLSEALY